MWQVAYLAFHFALLAALVWFFDRKDARDYVFLGVFGLLCAFAFENATAYAGFWTYHDVPLLPLVSVYSLLLYVPYLGFCYFLGRKLVKKHGA